MTETVEPILVTLRYFDVDSPTKKQSENPRNGDGGTCFRVKPHSKFGSLVKKFGSVQHCNPNDLTFYLQDRFLNPSDTIEQLKLKDNDVIFVKRVIPVFVEFVDRDKPVPKKEYFKVLESCVSSKIEEDCTFNVLYRGLLTHLGILDETVSSQHLELDKMTFYKCAWENLRQKMVLITDHDRSLYSLGIGAQCLIIVECSTESFEFFQERINSFGGRGELTNRVKELESQLEESNLQLKTMGEKLEMAQSSVFSKASLTNTLQNENRQLASDLQDAKEHIEQAGLVKRLLEEEAELLKSKIAELESSSKAAKTEHEASVRLLKQNIINTTKSVNDEKIKLHERLETSEKMKNELLDAMVGLFNDTGQFLYWVSQRLKALCKMSSNIQDALPKSSGLVSKINLEPVDFDYLAGIAKQEVVPENFEKLFTLEELHVMLQRPAPMKKFLASNEMFSRVFEMLYKDTDRKGLSINEIIEGLGPGYKDPRKVTMALAEYQSLVASKNSYIRYGLRKSWDPSRNTTVYIYDGVTKWAVLEDLDPIFKPVKRSDIEASEKFKFNVLQQQDLGMNVYDRLATLEKSIFGLSKNGAGVFRNISKNLINMIGALGKFKDQTSSLEQEKQKLITQFKDEMAKSTDRVMFVQTYEQKLDALSAEIENLRQEKIKFENDNEIFAKFASPAESHANGHSDSFLQSVSPIKIIEKPGVEKPVAKSNTTANGSTNENAKAEVSNKTVNENASPKQGIALSKTLGAPRPEVAKEDMPPAKKYHVDPIVVEVEEAPEEIAKDTTVEKTTGTPPSDESLYINIRIEFNNMPEAAAYFKLKYTTRLRKVLKSYKAKLQANPAVKLSQKEIDAIKLRIGGKSDLDYSLSVKELNIPSMSTVKAYIEEPVA